MIKQTLRVAKRLVRLPGVRPVVDATGLVGIGRKLYNRRVIASGTHEAVFCGERLRFAVVSKTEIVRLDADFSEAAFLGRFLQSIRPGDVVFDIGANIGIWSLTAASRHRDDGSMYQAFEPDPTNCTQLSKNIEMNNLANVLQGVPIAFGDSAGEFDLFLGGDAGTGNHTLATARARSADTVRVRAERADEYCQRLGITPHVAKIDVEGFELSVLRGMEGLLRKASPRELFIEVHTHGQAPVSEQEVMSILEPFGYRVEWRHPRVDELHLHVVHAETSPST